MKRFLFFSFVLLASVCAAGAQNYATPETFNAPGPYSAKLDYSLVAAAQGPGVTFLGGDADIFKKAGEKADFEIDFSRTAVGKTTFLENYKAENGEEAAEKLAELDDKCRVYFYAQYNQRNKGMKVEKELTGEAPYRMVIHVMKLNTGNAWGSIPSAGIHDGESAIDGYITLVDTATSKVVSVVAFNNITSTSTVSKNLRIAVPFGQLGLKTRKALVK